MVKLIIFLSMLYLVASLATSTMEVRCAEYSEIVEIGGCNKYECGVRLKNGRISRQSTPVIGQIICLRNETIGEFKFLWFEK